LKVLRRQISVGWLFIIPALFAFMFFKWYPILRSLVMTFFSQNGFAAGPFCGFQNYQRAFSDQQFWLSWAVTLRMLGISLLITFWPPILMAVFLNELRWLKVFFRISYFIPAILPSIVTTILWKWIYNPDYGFLNTIFERIGIARQMFLNDPQLVLVWLVMPGLIGVGYGSLVYLAGLEGISSELYEAALIDGASIWAKIRYIQLPHLRPIIGIQFILALIGGFNQFMTPFIMTGGGPMEKSETIGLYMYHQAFTYWNMNYAVTISVLIFAVLLVLNFINLKLQSRGE
jgi:multiple sugar transport system permease protein